MVSIKLNCSYSDLIIHYGTICPMSPRVIILALFFALTLLPQGWNKFDNTNHAILIYALGATLLALLFLSRKQL